MGAARKNSTIAVVGDVHGHLQLALCVLAQWQIELGAAFDAVFLCGDIGSFTEDSQLDNATRRHARTNPCELEFLTQWAVDPQPPWLAPIFQPLDDGGLGLVCPVIAVHGNHEGFAHLERIVPADAPAEPVCVETLPGMDSAGRIQLLPSGWSVRLAAGTVVGGIGGIDTRQREGRYPPMAYVHHQTACELACRQDIDILISHQGPIQTQGPDAGSDDLSVLYDETTARAWFHGHSIKDPCIQTGGDYRVCKICPLDDIAFPIRGPNVHRPGRDGWAIVSPERDFEIRREAPSCLGGFNRNRWISLSDGRLVAPPLARHAWGWKPE